MKRSLEQGPIGKRNQTAQSRAVDLLARRDRSRAELEGLLERAGYLLEEIEAALKRVVELGYLNEERLACAVIRSERLAGRGPRAAWQKLKRRGIRGFSLERVQAEWRGEQPAESSGGSQECQPELEVARAFVLRRYPNFDGDPKQARRALGALVRRGFSFEVARTVLNKLLPA